MGHDLLCPATGERNLVLQRYRPLRKLGNSNGRLQPQNRSGAKGRNTKSDYRSRRRLSDTYRAPDLGDRHNLNTKKKTPTLNKAGNKW